jgi:hypothetical protein
MNLDSAGLGWTCQDKEIHFRYENVYENGRSWIFLDNGWADTLSAKKNRRLARRF